MTTQETAPCLTPDPSLLAAAQQGDAGAFCRLAEPLEPRLFRQAMSLCGQEAQAEDLVSETLVEAWRCLARYDASCRLTTWLYAILLHRHQKALRHARSRPLPLSSLPATEAADQQEHLQNLPDSGAWPDQNALAHERADRVRALLDHLPDIHREVVCLRFFEDASLEDIARVLACSVGTVKSRLHHALIKLRAMNLSDLGGNT